jgi:serine/threonine-protein kinase ATR
MTRRGGEVPQRQAAVQSQFNGAPPPSTIAAQIVNDHSRLDPNQRTEQKAPFGQLLKEILRDPSSIEDDSDVNAKLISAVARRGLDVLQYDNLFNRDNLVAEAIDSLLVIEVIIQRYPGLLLYQTSTEDDSPGPCVFLWLIPKIVSFVGKIRLSSLQTDLQRLLTTCLNALRNTAGSFQLIPAFTCLYRAYSDGTSLCYFGDFPKRLTVAKASWNPLTPVFCQILAVSTSSKR